MSGGGAEDPGVLSAILHVWQQLQEPAKPKPQATKEMAARVAGLLRDAAARKKDGPKKEIAAGGDGLAPGVILRPLYRPNRQILLIPRGIRAHSTSARLEGTLSFPFTGEYQIFPTSSARLHHAWAEETGSLLENLYATAGGGSLETEAYQKLEPAIELSGCRAIRLTLFAGDDTPFGTSLQLVTTGGPLDLGSEIGGLERRAAQTIEFAIPVGVRSLLVQGIRLGFHRIPQQGQESVRVEVRMFTLEIRQ